MPLTPEERLAGVRLKIERAEQHVRDLHAVLTAFMNGNPYRLVAELDADTGDKVFRVRMSAPIPSDWPAIAGDVAHNLRSALDHLAWQLVLAGGGTPDRDTAFPIRESQAKYETTAKGAKIRGASPSAIHILDALKPYQGGNDGLWVLSAVNNHDKHKLMVGAAFTVSRLVIQKKPSPSRFTSSFNGPRFMEDGAEFGRLLAPHDDTDQVNIECSFEIAFVEPEIIKSQAVCPLLYQLCGLVRRVVDQFVPVL